MLEKTEGRSRMNNPETRATLGTWHRMKTNKTITKQRKLKRWVKRTPTKQHGEPGCSQRVVGSSFV